MKTQKHLFFFIVIYFLCGKTVHAGQAPGTPRATQLAPIAECCLLEKTLHDLGVNDEPKAQKFLQLGKQMAAAFPSFERQLKLAQEKDAAGIVACSNLLEYQTQQKTSSDLMSTLEVLDTISEIEDRHPQALVSYASALKTSGFKQANDAFDEFLAELSSKPHERSTIAIGKALEMNNINNIKALLNALQSH